jgi:poly(beta-D-mannuronate) lyase
MSPFQIQCLVLFAVLAASGPAADFPARRIDLANWKLTLPFDTARPGRPDELGPAELQSFSDPRCFFFDDEAGGVVFRAHCGGATTRGSSYPRCELREMTGSGKTEAAWATDDGLTHTLRLRAAITKTPRLKPHVVCAQIHDSEDDVLMIRLERTKLFIERNEHDDVELDEAYKLGTPFDLTIQAAAGRVSVRYDGALRLDWPISRSGCYFKAGCYTQSNPARGDVPQSCGEVIIHRLLVEHRDER